MSTLTLLYASVKYFTNHQIQTFSQNESQLCVSHSSNFSLIGIGERQMASRISCLHNAMNISHESRGQARAITPPPKVLTNSLYGDTSPIRKFFLSRRICIYLRRAPCTQIIYFSPVVTQHRQRGLAPPLFRRPTANAPLLNRYVFRITRLGIASWPGFAKEHSANFDNHSKFLPHRPYVEF